MRIGVIGINHKLASLKLREQLAQACHRRFLPGHCIHGMHIPILLSTCNRTEVYFSSSDLASSHTYLLNILRGEVEEDFDQKVYSYFGYDCFFHLARVTAGLDSAIVGETEIQGQVKATYEAALTGISLPKEIHFLFQKSLKIGKEVRTKLLLGQGLPDIEHAVFSLGQHFFQTPHRASVLFVGASEINGKILRYLQGKKVQKITVCNRSLDRAIAFAHTYGIDYLEWEHLHKWHQHDWVIFGTKSPQPLVTGNEVPNYPISQKLVVDLSVPRNVLPALGRHSHITLLNIDQVNRILKIRRYKMSHILSQAEQLVAREVHKQFSLFLGREQTPFVLRVS